jgi:hypothetical protein
MTDTLASIHSELGKASDAMNDIGYATDLLELLAIEGWGDENQHQRWLQAAYLARCLKRHTEDLDIGLERAEMTLKRVTGGAT